MDGEHFNNVGSLAQLCCVELILYYILDSVYLLCYMHHDISSYPSHMR